MPRKDSPDEIKVGSGQAGKGSVTGSSLTINVGGSGSGTAATDAINVNSETPPQLSGDNVQHNLNGINSLAPTPVPNRIGETANAKNSGAVNTTPDAVVANYTDGTTNGVPTSDLFNQQNITFEGTLFPADRGVLAVELDGTFVGALNLTVIFYEGGPEVTAAPSRVVGQNDYTAGSMTVGTVDGLPQLFDLSDRLPALSDYDRTNFPFLGGGDDPVYDAYDFNYTPYQLAKYSFTVDLGASDGPKGALVFYHFKTVSDYEAARDGDPYKTWSETALHNPYHDADTTTVPAITSYSFVPNDTSIATTPHYLSGIAYYSSNLDDFTVDWGVDGLFANSFLANDAAQIQWLGQDYPTHDFPYSDHAPDPILTSSSASYSSGTFAPTAPTDPLEQKVYTASPDLKVRDPFGRSDTSVYSGDNVLLVEGTPLGAVDTSEHKVENFVHEYTRYSFLDLVMEMNMLPDGSNSSWDPAATLDDSGIDVGDLQVRGIPSAHYVPEGITGGELAWPDTDYSTGHYPSTRDGSNPQRDYTALSTPAENRRAYLRAFDLGAPKANFAVRVVGHPTSGSTLAENLLTIADGVSAAGIDISTWYPTDFSGTHWQLPVENGGALVSYEIESDYSVVMNLSLPNPASAFASFYPVICNISMRAGTPVATEGTFAIYKIEILDR